VRKPIWLFLLLSGIFLGTFSLCSGVQVHAGTAAKPVLLVVNQGDRNLSVVDPVTARQTTTISEDQTTVHGHEAAASPDGRFAYVPIYGSTGVGQPGLDGREMLVIDIASGKITGNVDFGHGVRPHCAVYDSVSGMLYVTTELDQTVTIIDPRTLKIAGSIPTGQPQSHMLAISHDGRRGYTANVEPGFVSVLDMAARKTMAVIPISGTTQRISISNDDSMVFTSDQTKPQLAVIDTATNEVKAWVPLPSAGYGTASTRDGRWLLVALPQGKVAVVDLGTLKVARTIDVPGAPQEILVRPDGKVAYVSCIRRGQVGQIAVIDLSQWKVQTLIDAGVGADGLAWAGGS
jgi:DNA-binding beta-propeller fold protein YncE